MGELQSKRRDPVELAPDPAATRACAVRGRARGRASRRAQSLATFLGAGGEAVSGPRRGPSRTLGVVDAARIASGSPGLPEADYAGTGKSGSATASPACDLKSSVNAAASEPPDRVSRQAPSRGLKWKPPLFAAT